MCILCYQLAGEPDWTEAGPRGDGRRTALVARVVGCYGLDFRDTGAMAVVSNRKGAAEVVTGLTDLWPAAAAMAGRALDPLDEGLLERLDHGR
jgi:hypothetical protein